jgi:hypothetical protein
VEKFEDLKMLTRTRERENVGFVRVGTRKGVMSKGKRREKTILPDQRVAG